MCETSRAGNPEGMVRQISHQKIKIKYPPPQKPANELAFLFLGILKMSGIVGWCLPTTFHSDVFPPTPF